MDGGEMAESTYADAGGGLVDFFVSIVTCSLDTGYFVEEREVERSHV